MEEKLGNAAFGDVQPTGDQRWKYQIVNRVGNLVELAGTFHVYEFFSDQGCVLKVYDGADELGVFVGIVDFAREKVES